MSPNLNHRPGSGPTEDEFENTRIIGLRQSEAAGKLAAAAGTPLRAGVDYRTTYVQLSGLDVDLEFTITAGLRLRRAVARITGADLADVLVAGYSNAYLHYVTTPEEYDTQCYEGGSTLFDRWQLPALVQVVSGLAGAGRDGSRVTVTWDVPPDTPPGRYRLTTATPEPAPAPRSPR